MKAIVHDSYGSPDGLKVNEVDKPIPRADEVLIRVCATSVNQSDWIALTGRPYAARLVFGLLRPKHRIPGIAVAGWVEARQTDDAAAERRVARRAVPGRAPAADEWAERDAAVDREGPARVGV